VHTSPCPFATAKRSEKLASERIFIFVVWLAAIGEQSVARLLLLMREQRKKVDDVRAKRKG